MLTTCILLVVTGCNITKIPAPSVTDTTVSRSEAYDLEIRELLKIDADNKKWERIYLKEIAVAQDNLDHDAYRFFLLEYIFNNKQKNVSSRTVGRIRLKIKCSTSSNMFNKL